MEFLWSRDEVPPVASNPLTSCPTAHRRTHGASAAGPPSLPRVFIMELPDAITVENAAEERCKAPNLKDFMAAGARGPASRPARWYRPVVAGWENRPADVEEEWDGTGASFSRESVLQHDA